MIDSRLNSCLLHPYRGVPTQCNFGNTISPEREGSNSFLENFPEAERQKLLSWMQTNTYFNKPNCMTAFPNASQLGPRAICDIIKDSYNTAADNSSGTLYGEAPLSHFAIRTCNSFWNPTVTVGATNVDPFYLGMASQASEREDTIITPDLRGQVRTIYSYTL